MKVHSCAALVLVALGACGGGQQRTGNTPATDSTVAAPPAGASTTATLPPPAPGATAAAPAVGAATAAKTPAPVKSVVDSAKVPDHDRALKPRFKGTETTVKIDTMRRVPPGV